MFAPFLAVALARQNSTITVATLLGEMSDPAAFCQTANQPYRLGQASSYDRAKTDPKDAKTWFANKDYGQYVTTQTINGHKEWVLMDHQGPGAITRIWTPLLGDKDKATIRFYLDGSPKPAIEENFNNFMRGFSRVQPPFAFIAFQDSSATEGIGADLYLPIPFAKSCKVTLDEEPFYYCIDYRAYAGAVEVESFDWRDATRILALDQAAKAIQFEESDPGSSVNAQSALHQGSSMALTLPKGTHAATRIEVDVPPDISSQELRSTVIQMTADGEQTIQCPLSEFFGCGIHLRPVWDRYRKVEANGKLTCDWVMPYSESASVRVLNLGTEAETLGLKVTVEPLKWTNDSLHFHATWRYQYPLATRPMSDWNYLAATGQGFYVGDTLTVMNPATAWYGEGDEKVYVDGETFPSEIGTGTEDYYGYAWGMAEKWSSPFISMPERDHKGQSNWEGYTTTSRLRALDAIPFQSSIHFDMEIWSWADCQEAYAVACFWYAKPGAAAYGVSDLSEAARALPIPFLPDAGLECENMKVVDHSEGVDLSVQTGGLTSGAWSGGAQLFVQAKQVGDSVTLRFPLKKTGRYRVLLHATKSYDYGVVQLSVNGGKGRSIDFWSKEPVLSAPIDLGEFDFKGHDGVMQATVVSSNINATGSKTYFGFDRIELIPS